MKKSQVCASSHNLGTFPSPGPQDFGAQKGWCSERVPHPACSGRRNVNAVALTPFYCGRTVPSKWEDAERWICSPVSGYGVGKKSVSQPKSKSGPLGPPGAVVHGGGGMRNVVVGSPFSTGVLGAEGLSVYYGGGEMEKNVGWSDLMSESCSLTSSHGEYRDDKVEGNKDEENAVSRRDMGTQMSPEGSRGDSPSHKYEVRDVQVDKRATVISWSSKKQSPDARIVIEEAATNASKLYRDEARISAWESLQKAKAEAAIRKLEMKLEKKRSLGMDKILKELQAMEVKAHKMRISASDQTNDKKKKTIWFRHLNSLIARFTCHAF